MSIKSQDDKLFYLSCVICCQIEELKHFYIEKDYKKFEKNLELLFNLKNRWSNIALKNNRFTLN